MDKHYPKLVQSQYPVPWSVKTIGYSNYHIVAANGEVVLDGLKAEMYSSQFLEFIVNGVNSTYDHKDQ